LQAAPLFIGSIDITDATDTINHAPPGHIVVTKEGMQGIPYHPGLTGKAGQCCHATIGTDAARWDVSDNGVNGDVW
jgi:hypothetical protein